RILSQTPQSSQTGARPALQAGGVVTARVLRQTGAGQYVVSVAGQQVSVRSQVPLQSGAVFSATVSVRDGQVFFSLGGAPVEPKPFVSQFSAFPLQSGCENPLTSLLVSFGLPATTESFRLLQFAESMGMKIDVRQLRRALAAARTAGGGEETAQLALSLDEKGAGAEAVRLFGDGRGSGSRRQDSGGQGHEPQDDNSTDGRSDSVGEAGHPAERERPADERALLDSYFASVDDAATRNRAGMLTVFNTLRGGAAVSDAARWIILPFEWTLGYCGDIRLLTDGGQNLREIVVNAKKADTQWHFVVYCPQGTVSSVRFSCAPELDSAVAAAYSARLESLLRPLCASLKSVDYLVGLDGFCTQDKEIGMVGGEI
ncbi:MAG: hypothetical protein K2H73_09575, partial [Treponemataceae bacterium]|nr:hypothetical protein [Treponemataceae bacterium]